MPVADLLMTHQVPRQQRPDTFLYLGSVGSLRILLELGFRDMKKPTYLDMNLDGKWPRGTHGKLRPNIKEEKDEEDPHVLFLECCSLHGAQ